MTKSGLAKDQAHYEIGELQSIELIQMILTPEEFIGFCKGNVLKYNIRAKRKGCEQIDIDKAEQYSKWQRLAVRGEKVNPREG